MSNPSVAYLAQTEIDGIYFGIEDNLGESIHIHYAAVRINMSVKEFMDFSNAVMKATKELFSVRGIDLNMVDDESFKAEWAAQYKKIVSITEKKIQLDSLFMKESYIEDRSIKRIIPLRESGYISYYKNVSEDKEYYDAPGIYEPSRGERPEI